MRDYRRATKELIVLMLMLLAHVVIGDGAGRVGSPCGDDQGALLPHRRRQLGLCSPLPRHYHLLSDGRRPSHRIRLRGRRYPVYEGTQQCTQSDDHVLLDLRHLYHQFHLT